MSETQNNRKTKNSSKKSQPNEFLKYTGMGTKMAIVILGGVLAGQWLDDRSAMEFPLWTIILSLIGVAMAIYFVIKDTST